MVKRSFAPLALGVALLLLASCQNSTNPSAGPVTVDHNDADVSGVYCSSTTKIVASDNDLSTTLSAVGSLATSFKPTPTGSKALKARLLARGASGGFDFSDYSDEYVTVSGFKDLALKNGFKGTVKAVGEHEITFSDSPATAGYKFSASATLDHDLYCILADINGDGTKEQVPALIGYIAAIESKSLPDNTVLLNNNKASLSFSGTGMAYIRGVTGKVYIDDSSSANLTLNKASVTVKKLDASVGVTGASYIYHQGNPTDSLSGSLAASEGTDIELAFVLSSDSDKVKGGKIYIDIMSDLSVSFTAQEALDLYDKVANMTSESAIQTAVTDFLTAHGLSYDKASVTVSVKDNNNTVQYSKTFKGSEFVSFIPGTSS
jgi:hypothetical protein